MALVASPPPSSRVPASTLRQVHSHAHDSHSKDRGKRRGGLGARPTAHPGRWCLGRFWTRLCGPVRIRLAEFSRSFRGPARFPQARKPVVSPLTCYFAPRRCLGTWWAPPPSKRAGSISLTWGKRKTAGQGGFFVPADAVVCPPVAMLSRSFRGVAGGQHQALRPVIAVGGGGGAAVEHRRAVGVAPGRRGQA